MQIRTPDPIAQLAERAAVDWEVFMYDGLGIMPTSEQIEARYALGRPGPRDRAAGEPKFLWLSGGQRSGKTVGLWGWHCEANLYKVGVDVTDQLFWRNYLYKTLAVAPTAELALKLWQVADETSKGASDAQWDRRTRHARGGKFLHLFKAGKAGDWPVVRFENGARCDFRSTEGHAQRLEGDQWWFFTWDEWASQPDREIEFVRREVLMGRARDHDAKIVPAAWPKAQTERHLIKVLRAIQKGEDRDSKVFYLSAENAYFTNRSALQAERAAKDDASWKRTVLGQPAGGASIEFPSDVVENALGDYEYPMLPEPGYHYLNSWDLGLAHDDTVGLTWRLPLIGVSPTSKARIVNHTHLPGGPTLSPDTISYSIAREQQVYRAQSAIDATGLGGVAAVRQLRDLSPPPLGFKANSNDRIHGNIRLAAITNGLDLMTWERPADVLPGDPEPPWGVVEIPRQLIELVDQMANFDRDAKNVSDDWVWALLIGLWYIKRYFLVARRSAGPIPFDVSGRAQGRRAAIDMRAAGGR